MSKLGIYDGDVTPANNTDIDGTDSTGATGKVKDGDNYSRSIVSWLKRHANDLGGVNTVGGTANAMTVTLASTVTAITTGLRFQAVVTLVNTSATVTLVVTPAVGAAFASKNIKKYDNGGILVALIPGDNAPGLREYTYLSGPDCYVLLNPAQTAPYPPGTLYGLTLSNNVSDATNDIDIAVGAARDGADSANMDWASAYVKQADTAWAVGTNAGSLDTGAVGNSTYYIWGIKRPDTGVTDYLTSLSRTAPTMPANYTLKVLLGYFIRTGGVNGTPVWFGTSGPIGEFIGSNVAKASGVALTTATAANVSSISLPAGDWDVFANTAFDNNTTTSVTVMVSSISQTSATLDSTTPGASQVVRQNATVVGDNDVYLAATGPVRIVLTATTTIYHVVLCVFSASTLVAFGNIRARRVR